MLLSAAIWPHFATQVPGYGIFVGIAWSLHYTTSYVSVRKNVHICWVFIVYVWPLQQQKEACKTTHLWICS